MNSITFSWIWGIGLIIGLPLVTILLGEWIHRLKRRKLAFASTVRLLRDVLLPMLALLFFLQHLLLLDPASRVYKTVETIFWVCVIHASLSLLNVMLFEQAGADTWRSRVPKLLIDLARLFLILLGSAFVLSTVWKADLAGLVTALGISSIVIGLALQDTLGSIMSGIALLFERPFTVGDWLEVNSMVGQVIDINWRAIRLLTLDRDMVVIPHKLVGSAVIRNFTKPNLNHSERIQIRFSYNDPPNHVRQVQKSTALETQGVLVDPAPEVFTISYSDFAITFEVSFFISSYDVIEHIRNRFMTRVWYAAKRNGLTMPYPTRTVYNFDGPTSTQSGIAKEFSEGLQAIPSFVPINTAENIVTSASPGISFQNFAAGEKVIRQGRSGNELFIIVSGQAKMTAQVDSGDDIEYLTLKSGEFFGEMSLFSGEVSPVNIIATQDLELMRLSASMVNQMIDRQPTFAREIGQILEIRRLVIRDSVKVHQQKI
jgi:small-conductance mechanosensitive channel